MIRELLNFRSKMNTADQVELDRGGFLVCVNVHACVGPWRIGANERLLHYNCIIEG